VTDVLGEPVGLLDELCLRVGWLVAVSAGVLYVTGLVR